MPCSKPDHPTPKPKAKWQQFEELAAKFLEERNFKILHRNWRTGRLEVDLIVRSDDLIVFVEVKSASNRKFGHPAERVDHRKIKNLTRAAQQYLIDKNIENCDVRFDVITFVDGKLEYFPGAFEATE